MNHPRRESPSQDFDQRASTWDEDPKKVALARAIADGIRAQVPLNRAHTALDYGCGTGLLGFSLMPDLQRIVFADNSAGMLSVVEEKIAAAGGAGLRALPLDLSVGAVPSERFEIIVTAMALHHIPDTDAILARFFALLSSGGVLCVADLDCEDGSFHGEGFTGHNGFDRNALTRKAESAGFADVAFSTVFQMNKGTPGRQYPVFLMVAYKR